MVGGKKTGAGGCLVIAFLLIESLASGGTLDKRKAWGLSSSVTASSDFYDTQDSNHSSDASIEIAGTYKWSPRLDSGLSLAATKGFSQEQKLSLEDGVFRTALKMGSLAEDLKLGLSAQLLLPFSEESQQRSMITVLTLGAAVAYDLIHIGLKHASASYTLYLGRGLHRFSTGPGGSSNRAYTIAQKLGLNWAMSRKVSLALSFQHGNHWTYEGNLKQNFTAAEELTFDASDKLSFSLGHKNGGDVLRANGADSNIELFNGATSVVYSSVAYLF